MKRILFICHGNICRSPMAEFIMKNLVRENHCEDRYLIDSAAVSTEELGNGIYPPAKRILHKYGVEFDNHRAWQIRRSDYDRYDMLILMDQSNVRWLNHIITNNDPEHKIHLLMEFAGLYRDVADPWYTDDFETAYRDIKLGCEALFNFLENKS